MIAVPAEFERGELDEAISLARRSLNNYLKEAQPETALHAYRARLLGQVLITARADDALQTLEEAVRLSVQAGAPRAGRTFLGLAWPMPGRLDEADEQLRIALEGAKPGTRAAHADNAASRHVAATRRRKYSEALPWIEQSIAASATGPFQRGDRAMSLVELGLDAARTRRLRGGAAVLRAGGNQYSTSCSRSA